VSEFSLPHWPHAYGGPSGSGNIKSQVDDFFVDEILSFEPEGQGEHVFLHIEKRGENTEYIARLLARHAGVRQRDIGYAGLKDRHARTRQWFSVWLPGQTEPDWQALQSGNLSILQVTRHARKLKRGVLSGNRFRIVIRDWQGDSAKLEQQLQQIREEGFPNYFGEQRFGHQGQNLARAQAMFDGVRVKPEQRSIYLSAVRSYLFNQILARRVENTTWNQVLAGDVCTFSHGNSLFCVDAIDETLLQRLVAGEIHATAALVGKGNTLVGDEIASLEQAVAFEHAAWVEGLCRAGLESDRRALRVMPYDLSWQFEADNVLILSFGLPAGSYATALLREIVESA